MRVDPNYVSNLAAALDQSTSAEAALTNQLSSGLRVTSLQDDPAAVAQSTLMASSIAKDDTFVQTAAGRGVLVAGCGFDAGRGGDSSDLRFVAGGAGKQWNDQRCEPRHHHGAVERDSRSGFVAGEYQLSGAGALCRQPGIGHAFYARYLDRSRDHHLRGRCEAALYRNAERAEDTDESCGIGCIRFGKLRRVWER